mmetsp:Transcript_27841/g.45230  ORF Transcript_27841/g.45230 Transcript_27841/m.45230 type:complete len:126 (-) Transcript_27841:912-1289(-)
MANRIRSISSNLAALEMGNIRTYVSISNPVAVALGRNLIFPILSAVHLVGLVVVLVVVVVDSRGSVSVVGGSNNNQKASRSQRSMADPDIILVPQVNIKVDSTDLNIKANTPLAKLRRPAMTGPV